MPTTFIDLYQQWVRAEREASRAEQALMDVLRSDSPPQPAQVNEVRNLRTQASHRLEALLAEAEKTGRS